MANKGKFLERFVRQIEEILLPQGISVTANEKVFNDEGVQIAEFDIEIEGKVGSSNFKWLIECRDRPSHGPAPGAWIEQLVGRRQRFNFDKIIAVSSTGFADGAVEWAKKSGIEIRTVTEANVDHIRDWFLLDQMTLYKRSGNLEHALLMISEDESEENKSALKEKLTGNNSSSKILLSTETGEYISTGAAFVYAATSVEGLYDDLIPKGGSKKIKLQASYPKDGSHYVVETKKGHVRIRGILFAGNIVVTIEKVPIAAIKKYSDVSSSGEEIATTASFNFEADGKSIEISFNKIADTGQKYVLVSSVKTNA